MAILRRPLPRFLVWATLLVAVAIATGAAGLDWWLIALVELAAWGAVTLAERTIWHVFIAAPSARPQYVAPEVFTPPPVAPPPRASEPVPPVVHERPPAPEPVVVTREPEPVVITREPEPVAPVAPPVEEPARRRVLRSPVRAERSPVQLPRTHVRFNIWSLERLARDHPEAEELEYLVLSLREFADSNGQLPADFDPLVRESFGELLVG